MCGREHPLNTVMLLKNQFNGLITILKKGIKAQKNRLILQFKGAEVKKQ